MLIAPDRTRRLARLVRVLAAGEGLAARVAAEQSRRAGRERLRCALALQAEQETGHFRIAQRLCDALPEPQACGPALATLAQIERRIERDFAAGALASTAVGLQGVVEHLGEVLLEKLEPARHGLPGLELLHRKILAQERGHLRLGAQWLREAAGATDTGACEYFALGEKLSSEVCALLDDMRVDSPAIWGGVRARLEGWLAESYPHP